MNKTVLDIATCPVMDVTSEPTVEAYVYMVVVRGGEVKVEEVLWRRNREKKIMYQETET